MDDAFVAAVQDAAIHGANQAAVVDGLTHRELMRQVKVLVSVVLALPDSAPESSIERASSLLSRLASLQGESGLFSGGDNVQSPPDSAFTINDACDVLHLLGGGPPELSALKDSLGGIIQRAAPALLAGGVHTPNHRWELAAALARIHRSFPDVQLVDRVDQWLSEGIDIDADGFFSERSPNYASAVSIPSILAIAEILNRPDLLRFVEQNLELTLSLIASDDSVETLPSRRQDQGTRFPLSRYTAAYRWLAATTGREDFAWAAIRAVNEGVDEPDLLAELLLHPILGEALPAGRPPSRDRLVLFETASLAVLRGSVAEVVVFGGSDYGRQRRIRSGLAVDPTFFRLFAGRAVLDSVRLSRTFFGLGPFRADGIQQDAEGSLILSERLSGAYYGPLPSGRRRSDGVYELADEGRFSASMAFGDRPVNEVAVVTSIVVQPREDGADLDITIDGPEHPWSLELSFRDGGTLEGSHPTRSDGAHVLTGNRAIYRVDGDAIHVELSGFTPVADPMPYFPGEEYAFLSGTDAAGGVRLLIGGTAPSRLRMGLQADRGVPLNEPS